jgi:Protein of unknown function (DUF2934)
MMAESLMDHEQDPRELKRKIETADRIASRVVDATMFERLTSWAQELRSKLERILEERRAKQKIAERAYELWVQNGSPAGRDLDFWLQAENDIRSRDSE